MPPTPEKVGYAVYVYVFNPSIQKAEAKWGWILTSLRPGLHSEFQAGQGYYPSQSTTEKQQASKQKGGVAAGEVVQQLKALVALPEDPGSVPRRHRAANSLSCLS